jgi:hypothetical protein
MIRLLRWLQFLVRRPITQPSRLLLPPSNKPMWPTASVFLSRQKARVAWSRWLQDRVLSPSDPRTENRNHPSPDGVSWVEEERLRVLRNEREKMARKHNPKWADKHLGKSAPPIRGVRNRNAMLDAMWKTLGDGWP